MCVTGGIHRPHNPMEVEMQDKVTIENLPRPLLDGAKEMLKGEDT